MQSRIILERDTEPDVDVRIASSIVTVTIHYWVVTAIVVETTTTKDSKTNLMIYPYIY